MKDEGKAVRLSFILHPSASPLRLSFEDLAEAVGGAVPVAAWADAARAVCYDADATSFAAVVIGFVADDGACVLVVAGGALSAAVYLFVTRALLAALRRRCGVG